VGGAAQASDSIAAAFGGGVVAALGGLVRNKGISDVKDAQPVGGRDPQEIMRTLAKATDTAQRHYSVAAGRAGDALSEIWHAIDIQLRHTMMRPVAAPAPNISPDTSLNMAHFFPAGQALVRSHHDGLVAPGPRLRLRRGRARGAMRRSPGWPSGPAAATASRRCRPWSSRARSSRVRATRQQTSEPSTPHHSTGFGWFSR
jgi:hypothetical protein